MKQKYISYHPLLNSNLEQFGFKRKNKTTFTKKNILNSILQSIEVGHSTHKEFYTKYYCFYYSLTFTDLEQITSKLNNPFETSMGGPIGYFSPANYYLEWRVPDDATDDYLRNVITEVCDIIEKYIVPLGEKYSSIEKVLMSFENKTLPRIMLLRERTIIAMYYVTKQYDKMRSYINETYVNYEEWDKLFRIYGSMDNIPQHLRRERFPSQRKHYFEAFLKDFSEFVFHDSGIRL